MAPRTAQRKAVPPYRSQDPGHIRAAYALAAVLVFVALLGFAAGFLT